MLPPSQPLPGDNASSYLRRLQGYTQEGESVGGPDGLINRSARGTSVSLGQVYHEPHWIHRGEFDLENDYQVNHVVRVLTASTYTVSGVSYTSPVGTYICVQPVPPGTSSFVSSTLPEHLQAIAEDLERDNTVCYAPIVPEGQYWEQIGGGSGTSTLDEWNSSASYTPGTRVRYTGSITEYVWGTASYWVYPCIAHCERATRPLHTSGSLTGSVQVPYYPEPEDSNLLYWKIESMGIRQISTCDGDNGLTSVWSNTQDVEPSGSPQIILQWGP